MKTIVLSGASRGCGKTTVGEFVVSQLTDVAAVKITPKHKLALGGVDFDSLPSSSDDAADALPGMWVTHTEPEIVLARGTDTRRYWDAGADPVAWVRARDEGVVEAVDEFRLRPEAQSLLLVESTRYLSLHGSADVALFVYPNGETRLADSAWEALPHCDAIVVTRKRPGLMHLALLADERFPQEKLDIPIFSFNFDADNLAMDDRYRLARWLMEKLDLEKVDAASEPQLKV